MREHLLTPPKLKLNLLVNYGKDQKVNDGNQVSLSFTPKKLAREADSIQNTPRPLVIKQRSVIVDKDVDHVNSNS